MACRYDEFGRLKKQFRGGDADRKAREEAALARLRGTSGSGVMLASHILPLRGPLLHKGHTKDARTRVSVPVSGRLKAIFMPEMVPECSALLEECSSVNHGLTVNGIFAG